LSDSKIRAVRPREKRFKMTDGGGLVLEISPTGRKVWRYRLQTGGTDRTLTLGTYPGVTLVQARLAVLNMKEQGGNLAVAEARAEAARDTTFKAVAEALIERERPRWAASHLQRFENRMRFDVYPIIGDMDPRQIRAVDVIRAIKGIEERGSQNTAVRTVGMIGQVLRYGVAKGKVDRDVTADLRGGLDRPPPQQHMAAVTNRKELGQMLRDIWASAEDSYGKPALQLAAYLFQRPGEIVGMRWANVDLDAALWTYQVSKVGLAHAVPLPQQAVDILRGIGTVGRDFVFPSNSKTGHVTTANGIKFLKKLGWKDRQTVHGFRAVARTLIAEDLKVEPRLIEQQLSHGVAEAHGRAYNRTLFLDERRDMMQRYADHLDVLREAC
jgi:integrase